MVSVFLRLLSKIVYVPEKLTELIRSLSDCTPARLIECFLSVGFSFEPPPTTCVISTASPTSHVPRTWIINTSCFNLAALDRTILETRAHPSSRTLILSGALRYRHNEPHDQCSAERYANTNLRRRSPEPYNRRDRPRRTPTTPTTPPPPPPPAGFPEPQIRSPFHLARNRKAPRALPPYSNHPRLGQYHRRHSQASYSSNNRVLYKTGLPTRSRLPPRMRPRAPISPHRPRHEASGRNH